MKARKAVSKSRPSIKPTLCFKALSEGDSLSIPKGAAGKLSLKDSASWGGSARKSGGEILAEGIVCNFPFQSTIEAGKNGDYILKVNKMTQGVMQKYNSAASGGPSGTEEALKVPVEITRIGDEVETRIPADVRKAIAALPSDSKAALLWKDITPIARRDWIFWIITAKQEKTRAHRIVTTISKLSSGMRRVCCFPGIKWIMKNG